tara:strand:+ start:1405 stop:1581 length:177 start_codon:yes stop_codon:yes gene_type:complete
MKIGEKFTFYSNGKHKKALFLEQKENKIKAVICDDKMAGINIEINESQIINENQISMF